MIWLLVLVVVGLVVDLVGADLVVDLWEIADAGLR